MAFDLVSARAKGKARGWTDEKIEQSILEHLGDLHATQFDVPKALARGRTSVQINEYLATFEPQRVIRRPQEEHVPERFRDSPNLYGALGAAKALVEPIIQPFSEASGLVGGARVGSTAGGAIGGPIGAAAGAVIGGGLGYGIAKKGTKIVEQEIRRAEEEPLEYGTLADELLESASDIKTGAQLELAGSVVVAPLVAWTGKKLLSPMGKKFKETPKEAVGIEVHKNKEIARIAKKYNVKLTPGEKTEAKSLALIESMLEKSITATDITSNFRVMNQLTPLMKARDRILAEVGSRKDIENVGHRIYNEVTRVLEQDLRLKGDTLEKLRTQVLLKLGGDASLESVGLSAKSLLMHQRSIGYNHSDRLYRRIGNMLGKNEYEIPKTAGLAKKLLDEELKASTPNTGFMKRLRWLIGESDGIPADVVAQIEQYAANPELQARMMAEAADMYKAGATTKTWKALSRESSDLRDAIIKTDELKGAAPGARGTLTAAGGRYALLRKTLQQDMEAIAKTEGGDAWSLWKGTQAYYGRIKNVYSSGTIKKMMKADPEKLADLAFTPNSIQNIRMTKNALGPAGFQDLRKGFTNKLMGVDRHGVFKPEFLRQQLNRYSDSVLKEVYTPNELKFLRNTAEKGIDLSRKNLPMNFLASLTTKSPSVIVDTLIGAPEAKLQSITIMKNLGLIKRFVSKDTWGNLRRQFFEKMFKVSPATGILGPEQMAKQIDKYGPRVMKVLGVPKSTIRELSDLSKLGHRLQTAERIAGNPSGTGQTIMTWGTMGMVLRNPVKGTLVALAPKYLAKLMLNKHGMKWLSEGFKTPVGSREAVALFTKISGVIVEDKFQGRKGQ